MPKKLGRKQIAIDRSNAHQFWLIANELRARRPDLAAMLRRYPVEMTADGFRCMVANAGEVDDLIREIERGLAHYRRQRPQHRRPYDMSCHRVDRLAVSSGNVKGVRVLIASLQANRKYILENIRRYPLECIIGGRRYVFDDAREIDWLIGALKRKAREAEINSGKPWWEGLLALVG